MGKSKIPGLSFSWKRATGISRTKSKISKKAGIPIIKSGRQRKAGRLLSGGSCVIPIFLLSFALLICSFCFLSIQSANANPLSQKSTQAYLPTPHIYSTQIVSEDGTIIMQCLIKGNISSKKEKIYHLPNQQYYEKTKIDESKGEKWFCTEEEAKEAGWRKSKK